MRKISVSKIAFAAGAVLLAGPAAAAAKIAIRLDGDAFRVTGLSSAAEPEGGWSSVFRVYAGEGDVPPLGGSYFVEKQELIFHPRFPVTAGVHYRAVFTAPGMQPIAAEFDGPKRATTPLTRVDRIYPTSDVLPANALRFYIAFSAPMSRGDAWQHIHLIDADNNVPVEYPFLELEQELWDQTNQRLTVLFDPGRIKRGLVPTNTIGPAVVEGKSYKLAIDRDWPDARGVPLVEGFEKTFRGGPADRVPPAPAVWRVTPPRAGTTEPLIIGFPKPMDYVLLQRMIGIFDANGEVAGKIAVGKNETEWRFTPRQPWKPGSYRIEADNTLEDISGNHLDRPFDVDVFETVTQHIASAVSSISFTVR